jgi:hypothetical protein
MIAARQSTLINTDEVLGKRKELSLGEDLECEKWMRIRGPVKCCLEGYYFYSPLQAGDQGFDACKGNRDP